MNATQIIEALRVKHRGDVAFFPEVRVGTGYGRDCEQRIDVWVMDLWPSRRHERTAYEVKVSRSDFLAEIRNPSKWKQALLLSNLFYFAAPVGLIKPGELPPEAGLIEIDEAGNAFVRVSAPWRDAMPVSTMFLASLCRRISKQECDDRRA